VRANYEKQDPNPKRRGRGVKVLTQLQGTGKNEIKFEQPGILKMKAKQNSALAMLN